MKRRLVAIAVLCLGIGGFSPEARVVAGQQGAALSGLAESREATVSSGDAVPEASVSSGDAGGNAAPTVSPKPTAGPSPAPMARSAIVSLQVPQRIGVVIDPWEMRGKGQVYSETYAIRNTGETAGTLTLSFLCRTGEQSGAVLQETQEGLHDGEGKQAYIEILFGDGGRMVLSQESAEYQVTLEPEEELQIRFSGEVNENASESWQNGDILIEGVYSWEAEEAVGAAEESEAMEEPEATEAPKATEEPGATEALEATEVPEAPDSWER